MPFSSHAALRCPLDALPLDMQGGSLRCEHRHSFDIARQGYVNLLGAQDKRSRDPGDSQAMVTARQHFLEAGYYQPIADGLAIHLLPYLLHAMSPSSNDGLAESPLIVDAGCGEGYYLQQLRQHLRTAGQPEAAMLGFDISKWAVQAAARRFPATWLVASIRNIPLADASADVLLDMFGFPDFEAFARVLKPAGLLLRVRAGDDHLRELREIIYPELRARSRSVVDPAGFSPVESARVSYEIEHLEQPAIGELLLMTPHLFRASVEGKERAAALQELSVSVDVSIDLFERI